MSSYFYKSFYTTKLIHHCLPLLLPTLLAFTKYSTCFLTIVILNSYSTKLSRFYPSTLKIFTSQAEPHYPEISPVQAETLKLRGLRTSAVSRKRREFCRFLTFQERQKTAFGLFLANSGISCISEGICI